MNKKVMMIIMLTMIFLSSCGVSIDLPTVTKADASTEYKMTDAEVAASDKAYKEKFIGDPVPEFKMKNLNGKLIELSKLNGTPYILYFARTDCPSCDDIYPSIKSLKDEGYLVISVYRRNTKDEIIEKFPDAISDTYQLSGLEDEANNNVLELFELESVPTLFFVDSSNIVRDIVIGFNKNDDLLKIAKKYCSIRD